MIKDIRLAFLGAGKMCEALLRGVIAAEVIKPESILVSDIDRARLDYLANEYGVIPTGDNAQATTAADVIILAVKPQQINDVLVDLADVVDENKTLISIAAGVPTDRIEAVFDKHVPVVRVMPNTPALVGEAMSAVTPGRYARRRDLEYAQCIFEAVGEVLNVPEDLQDKIAAISGSGPAYVFLLAEAMTEGAARMGLPESISGKLVTQTVAGSAELLKRSAESPAELREAVTSPGGTTMAAVQVFEEFDFKALIWKAIDAAAERAAELAG